MWQYLGIQGGTYYFYQFVTRSTDARSAKSEATTTNAAMDLGYSMIVTDSTTFWHETITDENKITEKCASLSNEFFKLTSPQLLSLLENTLGAQPRDSSKNLKDVVIEKLDLQEGLKISFQIPLTFIQFQFSFICVSSTASKLLQETAWSWISPAELTASLLQLNHFWIWCAVHLKNLENTNRDLVDPSYLLSKFWPEFLKYCKTALFETAVNGENENRETIDRQSVPLDDDMKQNESVLSNQRDFSSSSPNTGPSEANSTAADPSSAVFSAEKELQKRQELLQKLQHSKDKSKKRKLL